MPKKRYSKKSKQHPNGIAAILPLFKPKIVKPKKGKKSFKRKPKHGDRTE